MDIREKLKKIPAHIKKIPGTIKRLPEIISDAINGYMKSYRNGVEKFGIWWTVFQLSIWGLVLVFIVTAIIIVVVYLPKIEMIHWELR